jgi:hypothetical protein
LGAESEKFTGHAFKFQSRQKVQFSNHSSSFRNIEGDDRALSIECRFRNVCKGPFGHMFDCLGATFDELEQSVRFALLRAVRGGAELSSGSGTAEDISSVSIFMTHSVHWWCDVQLSRNPSDSH